MKKTNISILKAQKYIGCEKLLIYLLTGIKIEGNYWEWDKENKNLEQGVYQEYYVKLAIYPGNTF